MPDLSIEHTCDGIVAGIDEAGRGPWAGPVVAAAVVLNEGLPTELRDQLNDSKKLVATKRQALLHLIRKCADIGIGAASVTEIERHNILAATHTAMKRAILRLSAIPDIVLIDGNNLPSCLPCSGKAVVKGDTLSLSIAAASIVAKVTRDRTMAALAARYPDYGWERNVGYGTRQHQDGLFSNGITPHHRRTFGPITKLLGASHRVIPKIV